MLPTLLILYYINCYPLAPSSVMYLCMPRMYKFMWLLIIFFIIGKYSVINLLSLKGRKLLCMII